MAGPAPKTDKWTARENHHGKLGCRLIVGGLVEVTNTNRKPVLKEAAGGGGKTLALDLTIETGSGGGNEVVVWKRAAFSKVVSHDQYDRVEIRWDGKAIATVQVRDDDEYHQHLTALTQAANKAHAKDKPPTPAKPKPVPKKPAPAPGKKGPAPKKRSAAKKRPAAKKQPAAKKRAASAAKKRAPAAKKRAAAKKRTAAKRPAAKKRAAAKKRTAAKKRRTAKRR